MSHILRIGRLAAVCLSLGVTAWSGTVCRASQSIRQVEAAPPSLDEAVIRITVWGEKSATQDAAQAAKDWLALKKELGDLYDRLPVWEKSAPFGQLSWKFFGEENYVRAFDMALECREMGSLPPDCEAIYMAALAGKKDWLQEELGRATSSAKGDVMERFVRAGLAWASGDYEKVVAEASTPDHKEQSEVDEAKARRWLELLHARAIARQGDHGKALDKLVRLVGTMRACPWLQIHMISMAADMAERANRQQEAFVWAQLVLRLFPISIKEKSWSRHGDAIRAMAQRANGKMSDQQRQECEVAIERILREAKVRL